MLERHLKTALFFQSKLDKIDKNVLKLDQHEEKEYKNVENMACLYLYIWLFSGNHCAMVKSVGN